MPASMQQNMAGENVQWTLNAALESPPSPLALGEVSNLLSTFNLQYPPTPSLTAVRLLLP